ncbi:MAG TPA: phosphoribosylglycinamide formyltransferase [Thermoleophilaceae bacterium]
MSYRIAVLVSGEGSNLQAILDKLHGKDGIEVVGVGSNRADARGLGRAQRAEVETGVFDAGDFGGDRVLRDRLLGDWLDERSPDLIVLAGFMEILSPEFMRRFQGKVINVHPSLLPAFRGIHAIEKALDYGVRVTGVTVHFVDEGVDSGPIILQQALELPYSAGLEAIEESVHAIEHDLLPRAIRLLASGAVRIDPDNPRRVLIEERADV